MSTVNLSHIRSVWRNAQFDFAVASAKGKSGGIMLVWNPLMFTKHAILCMDNMVIVKGEWKKLKVECYMVNVYAPQDENEKKNLWCLIESFMSHHPGMYCLFGDFNLVQFPEERLGSVFSSRNATNFNDFVDRLRVVDVPLGGLKFTRVDPAGKKFSKLDRFLLSEGLLDSAPNLEATIICSRLSDHRPIVLKQKEVNYGVVPFKFYNSWLNWEGLDKVVQDSWELEIQGRGVVKHVQKNHSETKFELQADLEKCEMEMEQGKGSDSVLLRRNEVRFEKGSTVPLITRSSMFRMLSDAERLLLEAPVTLEEIKSAVWSCGSDKSPGPDGFTIGFVKHFWDIIKGDIFEAIESFFL
ncbi:uncharacterized protein LOC143612468 [Bidens hawaiensis]|uniref:uncharacterized protein LOC143612468 n=1 Tax=Bidens hawaiensis TaxID=980011 RepID=UPI00404AD584